jgi:DnaJ family protein A protein 2
MVKDTKLYDILELLPNASEDEINKKYKKLAIKYHPDRNPNDPNASKKLQELNEAKEILSDPEKREIYDQYGLDAVNGNGHPGHSHEDMFSMFGNHPFSNFGRERRQEKENIVIQQEVSLEDIYNQKTIKVNFKQKNKCEKCNGEGTKDGKSNKCQPCDGKGVRIQIIQMGPMIQQVQSTCGGCKGSGKVVNNNNKCNECGTNGYTLKDMSVDVPLKNGLSNGHQIQLQNLGHNLKSGKTDVIIVIKERKHDRFKRNGCNLIMDIELKLFQALFGFDKIIKHLDGRELYISHTGITEYNTKRKIFGEGMSDMKFKTKGDLIINFTFKLPLITNPDIIQTLQNNLKSFNKKESDEEVEIRINSSKYIKTIMTDHIDHGENTENEDTEEHYHSGPRVSVEGNPQCQQQ